MNKTQRLKGAAALAAAMIVTAATAGAVLGQDDCDDEECLAEQSISALVEALTAGDTARSEEALSELFTDMRPLSDPGEMGELFADVDPGALLTENVTLNFVAEMLEAQGMSSEQVEQVLAMSGAFGTLTDEEGKAVVINHEEQYDPADPAEPSLPRFEEPLTVLEAAALQAFADGDIDKPTLDALMEVLVQE